MPITANRINRHLQVRILLHYTGFFRYGWDFIRRTVKVNKNSI